MENAVVKPADSNEVKLVSDEEDELSALDSISSSEEITLTYVAGVSFASKNAISSSPCNGDLAFSASSIMVLLDPRFPEQAFIENPTSREITAICFSEDGRFVAYGEHGINPLISVYNTKQFQLVNRFNVEGKCSVKSLAFHPRSDYMVVLPEHDFSILIYDFVHGRRLASAKWVVEPLAMTMTITRVDNILAVCGHRKIMCYSMSTVESNHHEINSMLDKRAVLLGKQGNYTFVDIIRGQDLHARQIYTITSCGYLCEIRSGDIVINQVLKISEKSICIKYELGYIFVGCAKGSVVICSPNDLTVIANINDKDLFGPNILYPESLIFEGDVNALIVNETTSIVTTLLSDHKMHSWKLQFNENQIRAIPVIPEDNSGSKSSEKSKLMTSHDLECNIAQMLMMSETRNLNNKKHNLLQRPPPSLVKRVNAIKITPDGKSIICGNQKGEINVYDSHTGNLNKVIAAHNSAITIIELMFDDEFKLFASGGRDRIICILDANKDYELVQAFNDHSSAIVSISLVHSNGILTLVSSSADGVILIRRAPREETLNFVVVGELPHCMGSKKRVYNHSNGYIITAQERGRINLFQADPCRQLKPAQKIQIGEKLLKTVTIDPTGTFFVANSSSGQYLFHIQAGQQIATLCALPGFDRLTFSPDLKYIINANESGCKFLWRLPKKIVEIMQIKSSKQQTMQLELASRETYIQSYMSCVRVCQKIVEEEPVAVVPNHQVDTGCCSSTETDAPRVELQNAGLQDLKEEKEENLMDLCIDDKLSVIHSDSFTSCMSDSHLPSDVICMMQSPPKPPKRLSRVDEVAKREDGTTTTTTTTATTIITASTATTMSKDGVCLSTKDVPALGFEGKAYGLTADNVAEYEYVSEKLNLSETRKPPSSFRLEKRKGRAAELVAPMKFRSREHSFSGKRSKKEEADPSPPLRFYTPPSVEYSATSWAPNRPAVKLFPTHCSTQKSTSRNAFEGANKRASSYGNMKRKQPSAASFVSNTFRSGSNSRSPASIASPFDHSRTLSLSRQSSAVASVKDEGYGSEKSPATSKKKDVTDSYTERSEILDNESSIEGLPQAVAGDSNLSGEPYPHPHPHHHASSVSLDESIHTEHSPVPDCLAKKLEETVAVPAETTQPECLATVEKRVAVLAETTQPTEQRPSIPNAVAEKRNGESIDSFQINESSISKMHANAASCHTDNSRTHRADDNVYPPDMVLQAASNPSIENTVTEERNNDNDSKPTDALSISEITSFAAPFSSPERFCPDAPGETDSDPTNEKPFAKESNLVAPFCSSPKETVHIPTEKPRVLSVVATRNKGTSNRRKNSQNVLVDIDNQLSRGPTNRSSDTPWKQEGMGMVCAGPNQETSVEEEEGEEEEDRETDSCLPQDTPPSYSYDVSSRKQNHQRTDQGWESDSFRMSDSKVREVFFQADSPTTKSKENVDTDVNGEDSDDWLNECYTKMCRCIQLSNSQETYFFKQAAEAEAQANAEGSGEPDAIENNSSHVATCEVKKLFVCEDIIQSETAGECNSQMENNSTVSTLLESKLVEEDKSQTENGGEERPLHPKNQPFLNSVTSKDIVVKPGKAIRTEFQEDVSGHVTPESNAVSRTYCEVKSPVSLKLASKGESADNGSQRQHHQQHHHQHDTSRLPSGLHCPRRTKSCRPSSVLTALCRTRHSPSQSSNPKEKEKEKSCRRKEKPSTNVKDVSERFQQRRGCSSDERSHSFVYSEPPPPPGAALVQPPAPPPSRPPYVKENRRAHSHHSHESQNHQHPYPGSSDEKVLAGDGGGGGGGGIGGGGGGLLRKAHSEDRRVSSKPLDKLLSIEEKSLSGTCESAKPKSVLDRIGGVAELFRNQDEYLKKLKEVRRTFELSIKALSDERKNQQQMEASKLTE